MHCMTPTKLAALLALSVLAGCSTSGIYNQPPVAVEDRSTRAGAAHQDSAVARPADPQSGVTVTPVAPVPVFRDQRSEPAPINAPSTPAPTVATDNPAVVALLDGARQQTNAGRLHDAQNNLQRALRIAPKNPQVYYDLADTHRRLGEFLQAEQVALKGVAVAQGQTVTLRRLWLLIAAIRNDAGDMQGANNAAAMAKRY